MEYEYSNLKKCPVEFDESAHTYTLDGQRLSGITTMLKKMVFPDMYRGVHKRTLDAAASSGSAIHKQVEMRVNGFGFTGELESAAVKDLFKWAAEQNIEFIASEYLLDLQPKQFAWDDVNEYTGEVVRYNGYASAIDIIDSNLNLYDVKTTYKFEREYVRWQLSIYAYMFERQNPTLKVNELRCAYLKNQEARIYCVDRIADEIIEDLLNAYADGLPWTNPFVPTIDVTEEIKRAHKADLAKLAEVETAIAEIERGKAEYEAKAKELRAGLMAIMEQAGLPKLETERLKLTIVAGSDSRIIDSARLKAERPEMWNAYSKISRKSASLRITLKDSL